MVKKKGKTSKKGKKRGSKEDVKFSTSLPPAVEGQLRCFLRVSVTKIDWMIAKPPDVTHVRLSWWGDVTDGTIFRPLDMKNPQKSTARTTARFPIRCGPKQFTAYLNDMGSLQLDVLKGSSMAVIGQIQINEIGLLAPQVPINGFFPVFSSKDSGKIADLHVSMAFEPLPSSYDSSSSMPTTDASHATGSVGTDSSHRRHHPLPYPQPVPQPSRRVHSSDDGAFVSPIKQPSDGEQKRTPRGIDSDYSFVIGPGRKTSSRADDIPGLQETMQDPRMVRDRNTVPTAQPQVPRHIPDFREDIHDQIPTRYTTHKGPQHAINPGSKTGQDLISALLDRGTKLRNAMVVSEVQPRERRKSGTETEYIGLPEKGSTMMRRSSSGDLFREILDADDKENQLPIQVGDKEESYNCELKTVELLIGDDLTKKELSSLKALQAGTSPTSSVSSHSDRDISEDGDPIHDTSILEELFYRGLRSSSDDNLSDLLSSDSEEERKERKKAKKKRRRSMTPDINDPGNRVREGRSMTPDINDPGNRRPRSRRSSSSQLGSISTTPPTSDRRTTTPPTSDRHAVSEPQREQRDLLPGKPARHSNREDDQSSSGSESGSTSRLSDGSRVSFDGPQDDEVKVSPSEGLSVERLTLLGKVHIARVMVDTLSLEPSEDENTPTRPSLVRSNRASRMRGKPPRHAGRANKKSYFVEYQFPVVASSRDKSLVNTMATEVMRLVSKKVTDCEASFGHRSVFPVSFNGTAVDRWWKQMVVFKIFSRTPGQKTPTMLGVSSLRLRQVLQSPDLTIHKDLVVRDKSSHQRGYSHSSGRSSEDDSTSRDMVPEIGKLKVTIELGSDNKDFSMALARTKLAEMRGAKIVSLPSNQHKLPLKIPTSASTSTSSVKRKHKTSQGIQTETDHAKSDMVQSGIAQSKRTDEVEGNRTSKVVDGRRRSFDDEVKDCQRQRREEILSDRDEVIGSVHSSQQVQYKEGSKAGQRSQSTEHEGLTLHSLLLIPEGRGITMQGVVPISRSDQHPQQRQPQAHSLTGWEGWGANRDMATRNTYLVCKMFWSDDSVRSSVCWGTSEPNYNFIQVAPVLLTASLLERTRNNVMVVEVWDKKTSAQSDLLVGIAKVSLHQFYMSFRDRRIADTLLKSQYPVVAVDNYINITDPFTGVQYGQIKVLLALGSMEQVSALQRLKCDKDMVAGVGPERPVHYLERGESASGNRELAGHTEGMVEHVFEVVVEGVRGMTQLDDSYWGEADCFVQYHFPSQPQRQSSAPDRPTQAGAPILKPQRTATTLCVPDPTFHDVTRHRIVLPQGVPAQRELLTACAGVGGGAGGIPFEVWNRYYYPNIRDQVAAKALLPLAKLCAMVTMQRRGEPSVQTFSLPLKMQHVEEDNLTPEQKAKLQDAGLLDVTISYKNAVIKEAARDTSASQTGGPHVCLSVGVLRACGLKMAARHLAQFDAGMQYASEVGVNAYVKMELSFLAKQDMRISRTIARTFAPEFSHHVDFPCPLLLCDGDNDTVSLAEALETAEMKLQIWHQTPGFKSDHGADYRQLDTDSASAVSARKLVPGSVDVLMGTATIPLHSLLTHRTGIQGWVPLTIPSQGWAATTTATHPSSPQDSSKEATTHRGLERVGGGLELCIKFAHQNDREKVVDAARRVGWSPHGIADDVEVWEEDPELDRAQTSAVTINTDAAWFPDCTALRPGQDALDTQAKAYIRYKFYDKAAVCSKLCYLDVSEDGYITADFRHSHKFKAAHTQPFTWYLREERLEIQLWVSYNQDELGQDQPRPRHRDKLIGCAYVDLSPLLEKRSKHHRVSGLYPLFKPGASNLGGACLRVHVNLETSHRIDSGQEELDMTDDISIPAAHSRHTGHRQKHVNVDKQRLVEDWLEDEQGQEMERQRKLKEEEDKRQAEEAALRNRPVSMKVMIERAMHLRTVDDAKGLQTVSPNCYVTFQSADEPCLVQTPTIACSQQPTWGFETTIKVSKEVLENQCFIVKVWHQTGSTQDQASDRVLGFCSIDMGPLLAGFRSLNGWYNIMDFSRQCHGQIKVSITPSESLSPLKRTPKHKTLTMSPNTSAVFIPGLSYVVPHPAPPGSLLFSEKTTGFAPSSSHLTPAGHGHFQEHLKNIRHFHEDLQSKLKVCLPEMSSNQAGASDHVESDFPVMPSSAPTISSLTSSFLVQNLRKNLQELDVVHKKLQQRLSTSDIHKTTNTEPSHVRSKLLDPSCETEQRPTNDNVELGSENSSPANERTPKFNANHQKDMLDNLQDNRQLLGHKSPPSEVSEDWEDSVQFSDDNGRHHDGENHHRVMHQLRDADGDYDDHDLSDVIVPKALNDVSSANFGNSAGKVFQEHDDPLFVRLQEQTDISHVDRTHDSNRMDIVKVDHDNGNKYGTDLPEKFSNQDSVGSTYQNKNNQRKVSNNSDSEDSIESVDENQFTSQEPYPHRTTHSSILPQNTVERGRDRVLADATNYQRPHDVGEPRTSELTHLQGVLTGHPKQRHGNVVSSFNKGDSLPFEDVDPKGDLASRHLSQTSGVEQNISKNDKDLTSDIMDIDSIPRTVQLQTSIQLKEMPSAEGGGAILQRQRSLSLSSEDSIILTLDPEVAKRQQRLMEGRSADSTNIPQPATSSVPIPNFFLPPQDLEASMRALHNAVTFLPRSQPRDDVTMETDTSYRLDSRYEAAAELASRLGTSTTHPKISGRGGSLGLMMKSKLKVPSADEAKRIARIFGSKYSGP